MAAAEKGEVPKQLHYMMVYLTEKWGMRYAGIAQMPRRSARNNILCCMNRLSEDIPNLKHTTIKKEELGVQTWKIERLLERAKAGCTVLHPLATGNRTESRTWDSFHQAVPGCPDYNCVKEDTAGMLWR